MLAIEACTDTIQMLSYTGFDDEITANVSELLRNAINGRIEQLAEEAFGSDDEKSDDE